MGEMFEKARVFVKNVTEVVGKADGDRFKCPRCKGSGLNSGNQFWNRNQSSPTTESCWFCEGVGVMPLIGLNGFMFGPSKPIINTRNVNPLPELPMKMQLYLGKYPETKCTVKTYKPSMKLADLLYDPTQIPSWMNGADEEAMFSRFQSAGEISERESSSSLLTSTTTNSSEPSKQQVYKLETELLKLEFLYLLLTFDSQFLVQVEYHRILLTECCPLKRLLPHHQLSRGLTEEPKLHREGQVVVCS